MSCIIDHRAYVTCQPGSLGRIGADSSVQWFNIRQWSITLHRKYGACTYVNPMTVFECRGLKHDMMKSLMSTRMQANTIPVRVVHSLGQ